MMEKHEFGKRIEDDFKQAKKIYEKVKQKWRSDRPAVEFILCLIYVRQLKHHKYEEKELKLKEGYGEL